VNLPSTCRSQPYLLARDERHGHQADTPMSTTPARVPCGRQVCALTALERTPNVPELTAANIEATFTELYGARADVFERGELECFRRLSWDYRTNQPFRFGKRIILKSLFSYGSLNGHGTNELDDLMRVFHVLDGKPEGGSPRRRLLRDQPRTTATADLSRERLSAPALVQERQRAPDLQAARSGRQDEPRSSPSTTRTRWPPKRGVGGRILRPTLPRPFPTTLHPALPEACPRSSSGESMTEPSVPTLSQPRLPLGHLLATPGAVAALTLAGVSIFRLLNRHARGDWGDLSDEDRQQNDLAIITGQRVLSSYPLETGQRIWVITESDRAATTVLLPEDY